MFSSDDYDRSDDFGPRCAMRDDCDCHGSIALDDGRCDCCRAKHVRCSDCDEWMLASDVDRDGTCEDCAAAYGRELLEDLAGYIARGDRWPGGIPVYQPDPNSVAA